MRNGLDPEAAWDSLDMILHACLADWVMSLAGDTNTLLSQLWLLVGVTSSELQCQGRGASTSLDAPITECKQDLLLTFRVCMLKLFQSCPTLCYPLDCSSPVSSVHGILQARILEWVAIPSSRGSSGPRDWNCISYISCLGKWVLYQCHHLGGPFTFYRCEKFI